MCFTSFRITVIPPCCVATTGVPVSNLCLRFFFFFFFSRARINRGWILDGSRSFRAFRRPQHPLRIKRITRIRNWRERIIRPPCCLRRKIFLIPFYSGYAYINIISVSSNRRAFHFVYIYIYKFPWKFLSNEILATKIIMPLIIFSRKFCQLKFPSELTSTENNSKNIRYEKLREEERI